LLTCCQFLVRVAGVTVSVRHLQVRKCGSAARCARSSPRHWRMVGWSTTLKALAPRLRCSQCGKKAAEVVAVARPRGMPT